MSLFSRAQDLKENGFSGQLEVTEGTDRKSLGKAGVTGTNSVTAKEGTEPAKNTPPDYQTLAQSQKSHFDVDCLDSAFFLFALQLVRTCPDSEFMAMGHRFAPHWRSRMAPEAWGLVKGEIKQRLKTIEGKG